MLKPEIIIPRTNKWAYNTLEISEEPEENEAVLLITRCCPRNHEHIALTREQAGRLGRWLLRFSRKEMDVEVPHTGKP